MIEYFATRMVQFCKKLPGRAKDTGEETLMRTITDVPPLDAASNLQGERAVEREAQRMQVYRLELVERIGQAVRANGSIELLPSLHLTRASARGTPIHSMVGPSLCIVAQGSKEFLLGESRYRYDPLHYLLVTVDLPYAGQVVEASVQQPFLGLRLELAPAVVSAVMLESGHISPSPGTTPVRAIAVSQVDADLLDAAVRLVRLLDAPLMLRFSCR
jgi:AraC-type transcriptional regulator N-terminus